MISDTAPKRIILLEFNELCPRLLTKWMEDGSLPNFKKFFEQSQAHVTIADAEPPALEPWIQWFSLHTGLGYDQHKVFRLTDGVKSDCRDIWEVARQAGLTTFNCSSMNAKGFVDEGSIFIPDPWCTSETAHPEELNVFHGFVARQVQEYTNRLSKDHARELARVIYFLGTHGLRAQTVRRIVAQLFSEKIGDRNLRWKRVAVLDWLQADLFLHYWRRCKPNLSTFFSNSTAHLQHAYWRYMEPEIFEAKADPKDIERYRDAILFGYQNMDRMLADFFSLERELGATLILATALSQQPYLKYEATGGQKFYRPHNIAGLLEQLGVRPKLLEPTMTHQYIAYFESQIAMVEAGKALERAFCGPDPVFDVHLRSDQSIYFGCQLREQISEFATMEFGADRGKKLAFFDCFYMIDQTKSGYHHPDGVLWIKNGMPCFQNDKKVSILDVFPTLLELLGLEYGSGATYPLRGQSLVSSPERVKAHRMELAAK